MLRELALLTLLAAAPPAAASRAEGPVVYGVLPLRYLAGSRESAERVLGSLQAALEVRGARFVSGLRLEEVLRVNRIRQTDSVSPEDAAILGRETGVRYLIAGTLLDQAGAPQPRLAIALHLVDVTDGRRVLSSLVSLRGDDFTGILGLGTIVEEEPLALEVAARILADFDEAGRPAGPGRADLEDLQPGDALASYQAPGFDPAETGRLVVMPFVNRTNRRDAGRLFGDVLAHQWFRSAGVDVVEGSALRSALVHLGVRSLDSLDEDLYARIGEALGSRYFLLGSVDRYETGAWANGAYSPEIEASARLLDVQESRIVAAASILRRGDDYHVVLGLGSVEDVTALADRTARELVALMGVEE